MGPSEFRAEAHRLVDWMADYLENVRSYRPLPDVSPGQIAAQLTDTPPERGEPFERIFGDFKEIIVPGMTHWQHPSFHAYFPANSSPPSVLAEMLTATLGAQCMMWQTSPAATELEDRMMLWLRQMIGLPESFTGVIQDTASTATLCSLVTAREKYSGYAINEHGFSGDSRFAVYSSGETHSSIEKDVKIAGLGAGSLRKIAVDDTLAMIPSELEAAIEADLSRGIVPLCTVATIGTTGSTAIDPLRPIAEICRRHHVWLHVDAAFAGNALILPEYRWMIDGIELADTFVFNPHKWMFTNFDCSAYFVRDAEALVRTFEILPEYLKATGIGEVHNFRDWGIALGRRFRALKLWFVIRTYGVAGLQAMIRKHIELANMFKSWIDEHDGFELMAPVPLSLVCFRYHPPSVDDPDQLNELNERLLRRINATGKLFLTHTRLNGSYTLRMVTGQTNVTDQDVRSAWEIILSEAAIET